uniref:Dynein light chain n=1 Tax=Parastrongyloides trichosuri TaxID=131310 RepID=A0A0N4Z9I8_PARTI
MKKEYDEAIIWRTSLGKAVSATIVEVAGSILQKHTCTPEIAKTMKEHLDSLFKQNLWHCIVGRSFGTYLTVSNEKFMYFCIGSYHFVLFQTYAKNQNIENYTSS